jgi:hypothetical protein
MAMTQQYLVGELSVFLGQLQRVATDQAAGGDIVCLRREAENTQPIVLTAVAMRALQLNRKLCWDSLTRGDLAALIPEIALCAQLHEWGVCAGLFRDG